MCVGIPLKKGFCSRQSQNEKKTGSLNKEVAEVMVNGSTNARAPFEELKVDRRNVTNEEANTRVARVFEDRAKRYDGIGTKTVTGGVGCVGTRVRAARKWQTTRETFSQRELTRKPWLKKRVKERREETGISWKVNGGRYQPRRDPAPGRTQGPRCRDTRPPTTRTNIRITLRA